MTAEQQFIDATSQLQYIESEVLELGFPDLSEFFREEPEMFDRIAQEWRENHQY